MYMYMAVRLLGFCVVYTGILGSSGMGLLPDTQNCSLRMHRECQERSITARASRTFRDACLDL